MFHNVAKSNFDGCDDLSRMHSANRCLYHDEISAVLAPLMIIQAAPCPVEMRVYRMFQDVAPNSRTNKMLF